MQKYGGKITITFLVVAFLFISILCCCVTGNAQAGIHSEKNRADMSECCAHKKQDTNSTNKSQCKCETVAEILVNKGLSFFKSSKLVKGDFNKFFSFSANINSYTIQLAQNITLSKTNSIFPKTTPLYLQDSILRL